MARISYDDQTAAAYKAVREIPRDGMVGWRDAVQRHLNPTPGMTLLDLGAGTGQFATAFTDWFGIEVVAVEPSDSMREQIPAATSIRALAGSAGEIPLPDASVDGAWLSLMIHHIPDLKGAAGEVRRVVKPGAPVLIRQGFPGRVDEVELVRWFPETARVVDTYPTVEATSDAFAAAGFELVAIERVQESYAGTLADFLGQLDTFRGADTTMRALTDDEFERGQERLREAVESGATPNPRSNTLDLLVLR